MRVPKLKPVNTSVAAQIETVSATIEQLKGTNENIKAEPKPGGTVTELNTQLSGLETELAAEKDKTDKLTLDIEMLQNAIGGGA